MLAYLYYEKSKNIFKDLSEAHYGNSEKIYSTLLELDVDKNERLIAQFEEIMEEDCYYFSFADFHISILGN